MLELKEGSLSACLVSVNEDSVWEDRRKDASYTVALQPALGSLALAGSSKGESAQVKQNLLECRDMASCGATCVRKVVRKVLEALQLPAFAQRAEAPRVLRLGQLAGNCIQAVHSSSM